LLAHTGQNYDYNLNGVFFKDLKLADPDVYMEAGNRCKDECLPEETNRRIVDIISDLRHRQPHGRTDAQASAIPSRRLSIAEREGGKA